VILTIKITGDDRDAILSQLRDITLELMEKPYLRDGSISGGRSEVWFSIGDPDENYMTGGDDELAKSHGYVG
jgi:hypothetical protein